MTVCSGTSQTKYQGVFFGVAAVFVEVASINFLNGESNLIAFAGVFQDRKIFFGRKPLYSGLGIIQTDINGCLLRRAIHTVFPI